MKPSIEDIIAYLGLREKELRIDMNVERFPPEQRERLAIRKHARIREIRRLKRHINQNTIQERNKRALEKIVRRGKERRLQS